MRKQFYPAEQVAFTGINTWRGVTRRKPILTGRSYLRIGSIRTGKIVIYPIVDDIDGDGNQLINWTTEIQRDTTDKNDWNKPGKLEDFLPLYADWTFDWLDVAALIRESDLILEYPMVDKDPVRQWTFGRVTLVGDAAHPMYPRGSNGAAQALIDGRTWPICCGRRTTRSRRSAPMRTPASRPPRASCSTNRETPPDFINIKVEELTGDRPFQNLDDFITQDELRALSDQYKRIAGFARETVAPAQP